MHARARGRENCPERGHNDEPGDEGGSDSAACICSGLASVECIVVSRAAHVLAAVAITRCGDVGIVFDVLLGLTPVSSSHVTTSSRGNVPVQVIPP